MAKPRFSNADKQWLHDSLVLSLQKAVLLSKEEAEAVVEATSTPMYIDVGRRIVRNTDYASTKNFTEDDVRRAVGEWLMYKAGVRGFGTDIAGSGDEGVDEANGGSDAENAG